MGILGILIAVASAGAAVALQRQVGPAALGIVALGGLIAAYLTRDSGRWALVMALIGAASLATGIWGVRTGGLPWQLALGFGFGGGLLLCVQAVASGLFSLAIGDHKQTAFVAMLIAAGLAYVPLTTVVKASGVPPIHDITTDTDDPPAFVETAAMRTKDMNPAAYAGADVAGQQKKFYPDLAPVMLPLPVDQAFAKALAAAKAMTDWEIVAEVPAEGRIEATATSSVMLFKDDVAIRVRAQDAGSRIDIRSKSRIGVGDVGANAERIRAYIEKLKAS
jgi:uncharacterized protein (DUF1499 family)